MRLRQLVFAMFFLGICVSASAQYHGDDPTVSGYVTGVTDAGFQVQGYAVLLTPKTKFYALAGKKESAAATLGTPYLGEGMYIFGKLDAKAHTVTARVVEAVVPGGVALNGVAIIDAIEPAADGSRVVRADGYRIRLGKSTTIRYDQLVVSLEQVKTNDWIAYKGVQGSDGLVEADKADIWPNAIDPGEEHLKQSREFKPEEVQEKDRQSGVSAALLGVNARKLPAHSDVELQARVDRIGQGLIPAYQKALPASDPTRINFRFQIVDAPNLRDAISEANGIILVPFPAITWLTSDAEVATVLADNIAGVLEKQEYADAQTIRNLRLANLLGAAASAVYLSPEVGLASLHAFGSVADQVKARERQQSGRVSLWLLHDAGYDLREAPIAWWRLAGKNGDSLQQIAVPGRASNLFYALGTTFRQDK